MLNLAFRVVSKEQTIFKTYKQPIVQTYCTKLTITWIKEFSKSLTLVVAQKNGKMYYLNRYRLFDEFLILMNFIIHLYTHFNYLEILDTFKKVWHLLLPQKNAIIYYLNILRHFDENFFNQIHVYTHFSYLDIFKTYKQPIVQTYCTKLTILISIKHE